MQKACFIEMEGVLLPEGNYLPDEFRAKDFLEKMVEFCLKKKIEFFLVSGFHESVAKRKFSESFLEKYFDEKHFLFVDENYISSKSEVDEKVHRKSLEENPEFNDSYFKQVSIQKVIDASHLTKKEVLLLCNDMWVDGYYTTRFSKVNFAIFQENVLDRGKNVDPISGLAYFSLEFASVKTLLENFPDVELSALDKFVFNKMKEVLLKDTDFSGVIKKVMHKDD
jgi:hypothetical protein